MRHKCGYRTLGRSSSHRRALLRNMATALVLAEHCETTVAKAKELRPVVEKLITLSKLDSLVTRRQAYSYLMDKGAVRKLFVELGPRYKSRPGGYARITRTRRRDGDAAEMAVIELIKDAQNASKGKAPKKRGSAARTGSATGKSEVGAAATA